MNKRQLQKAKTRALILESAKICFTKNGFLNTPLKMISNYANVAHGTIFAHFQNREALMVEVIDIEMEKIGDEVQRFLLHSESADDILQAYLNLLEKEEDFFAIIAKEMSLYSLELRRKLLFRESIIRGYFQQVLEENNAKKNGECADIASTLNWLFGVINYYLSLRDSFVSSGSVISKFKSSIICTFKKIIK